MTTATSSSLDNLFNADFYRANNVDLAGFNNQQALDHWRNFGINEGRLFSPLIDLNLYRSRNADLTGFGNSQLLDHLVNFGVNENRTFSSFLDLQFYQDNNPDLDNLNRVGLLSHLSTNGINESRAFSNFIDLNFYQASNPDLGALNNQQLFNHLFQYGFNEGRTFSPYFNLNFYRNSNPDLTALSNQQLFNHLHVYGLNEGRLFSPNSYNRNSGFGLVNAATAVAWASGQNPFAEVPNLGGNNWGLDRVNAPEAWNRGYTGQGIVVAVVDSGVDYLHPDLDNNIWVNVDEIPGNGRDDDNNGYIDDIRGWDFVLGDNIPIDLNGHGTQVAGIIAAENNGFGATGVAFNAQIMPVRVLNSQGEGFVSDVAAGIRYAADNGADVINLSLGGPFTSAEEAAAIRYAVERGAVVVTAAGNEFGFSPTYPGNFASHFGITVGAINRDNAIPLFSNFSGNRPLDYVVAPGEDIYSTSASILDGYEIADGTSFAAPYVAGIAALMLNANPNLSPVVTETILTASANPNVSPFPLSFNFANSAAGNRNANSLENQGLSLAVMDGEGTGGVAASQEIAADSNAIRRAMFGPTPNGFYDLTFGDDSFELTPGLLAGSPLGLRALDGNDFVLGSSSGEIIFGNQGYDFLFGGGGNDFVWGGKDDDFVYGEDGDDNLNGNMGVDIVFGGAGNDLIRGGKDLDVLLGEGGDDILVGDFGLDLIIGGTGSDLFVLRTDTDQNNGDLILDFNPFSDRIGLNGGFTQADLTLELVNIPMSSIGLTPNERQEYIQLTGVDIDPNGDGILSGTSITLRSGNLLGLAINVTPTNLSGSFVPASV